jgi:hypothetical protein
MPPPSAKNPLTTAEKEILKQWIAQGAPYKPHWGFVKPVRPSLPTVQDTGWPRNEIDHFILARLEKEGLKPSERADKYTLARRLYLDLIGLPPTPEQADAFVNDHSPNAYERLVDDLLASPHYGERWARRWLDLARYADTNGYEKDRPRSMWPYRDWVIKAFNTDMPFDEFTIEQIAGDMLPRATTDQIIATGFHRNTMLNEEGGIDPLEYRFYSMVDRVHVTATTWLGLTMACAQCHTHKYDPIQHSEYYSFMALLNNADEPTVPVPSRRIAQKREAFEKKIASLESTLSDRFPPETNIEWTTPGEGEFSSANGVEGEFLEDGSWRVSGKNPDKDTYTLTFDLSPRRITHVQLEAIPDEKVVKGGPGRTDHGNFVLSEIEMTVATGEPATERKKLKFTRAEADASQESLPVENAIDGKLDTGWAIGAEKDKRPHRHAIFQLSEPLELKHTAEVQIRLIQDFGQRHTLGRFRVSFGNDIARPGSIEERRKEARDRKFAKWLKRESEKLVEWQPLQPAGATSGTPVLTIEPSGSVFATGDFTKSDTYHLKFENVPRGITAIRLEVLPDDRLPNRGPGTVHYEGPEGDFWLSTLKVWAGEKQIVLTNATESFANGANTAAKAIDSDLQSGWSIDGGQGRSHNAVFQLIEASAEADNLQIGLTFERYYAAALGHFRIWITTEENAKASALSDEAYAALFKYRGEQLKKLTGDNSSETNADRDLLLQEFAKVAPELSKERKEIADLRASMPKFPTTLVMHERDHLRRTYRHNRGEFLQPKEEVKPHVPAFLPPLPSDAPANRLTFAKWLVSPENPLTARVTMNREWEAFFGRGIVRTLEDFGFQGDLPTHPELLDWLAVEFINQGWSLKKMHKLIVMSATYQQSSHGTEQLLERDPLNFLLARGPRFRIDAELIRDVALVDSGQFSQKLGGPSVFPPQPAGVSTEGAYGALQWRTNEGGDRYRRGLYTFAKRTTPYAMTSTFDGPSGEACLARRDKSNTPLQALTLLNDDVFTDAAHALGRWAASQNGNARQAAAALFRRCLTRPPTEAEQEKLLAYYEKERGRFASGELKPTDFLDTDGAGKSNEQAAWTTLARVLLNLDESITKE